MHRIADCADLRIVPTFWRIALPDGGFGRMRSAQSTCPARRIRTHDLKLWGGVRRGRSARPIRQTHANPLPVWASCVQEGGSSRARWPRLGGRSLSRPRSRLDDELGLCRPISRIGLGTGAVVREQPGTFCHRGGLHPGRDAEFAQDVGDVDARGPRADEQRRPDLGVGLAFAK